MIAVVDYGRGNLFSISSALNAIGVDFRITEDADIVAKSSSIIVPGVGAFGDAMSQLKRRGLVEAIEYAANVGHKVLGICVGMQILSTRSFEFGVHKGLNIIPGDVVRLADMPCGEGQRIPNIGWNTVIKKESCFFIDKLEGELNFYFVHAYGMQCDNEQHIKGSINFNGKEVAAIIGADNVWGCQFHPEKSGPMGLKLLENYLQN
tara:strand:- start:37 stop:654 length:618 start_codon:yes stop_codon:yes gene_type:complete